MTCKYGRAHLVINVLYFMLVCGSCFSNHDKRILLSDPDYVKQQMTHLQSELQTLQATVQSQNGELQTLQTTVQSQNVKISSLEQQLSYSNNETQSQAREIEYLKQLSQVHQGGGASFVRWGRTDCPANLTELVYSGYAGGSWYYDTGAAADRLCLPPDPEWLQTTVVPDDYTGRIYGAEYESSSGHTLFGDDSHNEEIPCAVCRSKYFASSVMIPARTTCYSGWTKAYGGSLTSGYYAHAAATEYLCVDEHAQPLVGGNTNVDGARFYGVKAFCGSLRCPPYKENKYISCVVCMK